MSENPASNIGHPASNTVTKALIIPAAGSGKRMKQEIPKPFLRLSDRTILEHTLQQFLTLKGLRQIVVPTSDDFLNCTQQILDDVAGKGITAKAVVGGKERHHSIYNSLKQLLEVDLVIIHDAVRPFVELSHIEACCEAASEDGAAILGIPVKDTIKRVDGERLVRETPNRSLLWQAQTPQVFKRQVILKAYEKAMKENYVGTDDASLVERMEKKVRIIEGDQANFKITYPLDLKLARLLIEKEQK